MNTEDLVSVAGDCFQCAKCSAGCPVIEQTDIAPHDLVRLLLLGQRERLLDRSGIWLCIGCSTCVSRCPNEVDLPGLIDALRAEAFADGRVSAEPRVAAFHEAFLRSMGRHGRVYDLGMIARFKRRGRAWTDDMGLGWQMFRRGKIRLLPSRTPARREVKRILRG